MRSAIGMVWSCQGAPSSPSAKREPRTGAARQQRRRLRRRKALRAGPVDGKHAGEEAVEPHALLGRERRAFGDDLHDQRRAMHGHSRGLRGKHFLQRLDLVAARESGEGFVRRSPAGDPALQHALDELRRVFGLHVAAELAADGGVRPEAAADIDVIALDGVALVGESETRAAEQPDVADIVLRAGVMAAGEMDIDRLIDRDAVFAPRGDLLGVALGVGGGEPAPAIAGAGDEAGADRAGA